MKSTGLAAVLLVFTMAFGQEEPGASMLMLYKKTSTDVYTAGNPFNVSLSIFNKGPGNAYSIVVADDNWKVDKFRIVAGPNNFTLDYLNAGDQYVHEFTVLPIKKTWHRIRPAKMAFIDGVEGENQILHLSNSLPDIRISAYKNAFEDKLLLLGRIATLNIIQTKQGWISACYVGCAAALLKLIFVAQKVLHKRRHLRALDAVKKL